VPLEIPQYPLLCTQCAPAASNDTIRAESAFNIICTLGKSLLGSDEKKRVFAGVRLTRERERRQPARAFHDGEMHCTRLLLGRPVIATASTYRFSAL
jgi:hypothetical protein